MRPELKQITLGNNAFQYAFVHNSNSGLVVSKDRIGFACKSSGFQFRKWRPLNLPNGTFIQRLTTGKTTQEQIFGQTPDHLPIFYHRGLADTVAS